jgi:hypothetical protein
LPQTLDIHLLQDNILELFRKCRFFSWAIFQIFVEGDFDREGKMFGDVALSSTGLGNGICFIEEGWWT